MSWCVTCFSDLDPWNYLHVHPSSHTFIPGYLSLASLQVPLLQHFPFTQHIASYTQRRMRFFQAPPDSTGPLLTATLFLPMPTLILITEQLRFSLQTALILATDNLRHHQQHTFSLSTGQSHRNQQCLPSSLNRLLDLQHTFLRHKISSELWYSSKG